jgi:hypothetical protein
MKPGHNFPPFFSKIHSNIILHSCIGISSGYIPFTFSNQNIVCIFHLSHSCCMSHPSHPPWFDHPNNVWWIVQVMKLLTVQCYPASCHFLPFRSKRILPKCLHGFIVLVVNFESEQARRHDPWNIQLLHKFLMIIWWTRGLKVYCIKKGDCIIWSASHSHCTSFGSWQWVFKLRCSGWWSERGYALRSLCVWTKQNQ